MRTRRISLVLAVNIITLFIFTPFVFGSELNVSKIYLRNDRYLDMIYKFTQIDTTTFGCRTGYRGKWVREMEGFPVINKQLKGDTSNIGIEETGTIFTVYKFTIPREEIVAVQGKSPVIAGLWGLVGFGSAKVYVDPGGNLFSGSAFGFLDYLGIFLLWNTDRNQALSTALPVFGISRLLVIIFAPEEAKRFNKELEKKYGITVIP